jgi:hypothetical protein
MGIKSVMTAQTIKRSVSLLVTANAPAHLQWSALLKHFHLFNFTVTLLALQPGSALLFSLNVTLVWKPHKIRKIMNFNPLDRLIFLVGFR